MEAKEIRCLSCDQVINVYNLHRHAKSKKHNSNVNKKVEKMKLRTKI
jgi:hypothetical protein